MSSSWATCPNSDRNEGNLCCKLMYNYDGWWRKIASVFSYFLVHDYRSHISCIADSSIAASQLLYPCVQFLFPVRLVAQISWPTLSFTVRVVAQISVPAECLHMFWQKFKKTFLNFSHLSFESLLQYFKNSLCWEVLRIEAGLTRLQS